MSAAQNRRVRKHSKRLQGKWYPCWCKIRLSTGCFSDQSSLFCFSDSTIILLKKFTDIVIVFAFRTIQGCDNSNKLSNDSLFECQLHLQILKLKSVVYCRYVGRLVLTCSVVIPFSKTLPMLYTWFMCLFFRYSAQSMISRSSFKILTKSWVHRASEFGGFCNSLMKWLWLKRPVIWSHLLLGLCKLFRKWVLRTSSFSLTS